MVGAAVRAGKADAVEQSMAKRPMIPLVVAR
jgi:hypothetical protein